MRCWPRCACSSARTTSRADASSRTLRRSSAKRDRNVQLRAATSRDDYVALCTARERTLAAPRLLYPSVQVNIDAGRLPAVDEAGRRFVRIPLTVGGTAAR